jgi:riboflavin biosynthesis pyrimidine reductase
MVATIDGKIDGASLKAITKGTEYEETGAKLAGDAWICGRVTMQQHFAEKGTFTSGERPPAGPQPVHVARRADSYAVAVDTKGSLLWNSGKLDGEHLISVVSEYVPAEYLAYLRDRQISYIVAGQSTVDLTAAVDALADSFGIKTLLLEGGGHINGAFLEAKLLDEVSLLLAPGIDGRHDVPSVFDGLKGSEGHLGAALKLNSVEKVGDGVLWLRYDVSHLPSEGA